MMAIPTALEVTTEIFSQPEMWRRAIQHGVAAAALPVHGVPALILGCGTSYYIGEAYASLRNAQDRGRTRAAVPAEIAYVDDDETIIVLSRSGTTSELIDTAKRLRSTHRVVGVIGTPETPLVDACHDVIDLSYANERAVMQTRFATTAFTLLRSTISELGETLIDQAEEALLRPPPTPTPQHVVFLGTGFSLGLAHEAALKCIEASGRRAEAYAANEYLHGPIAAAGSDTVVWPLAPISAGLAVAITDTCATLVTPSLDPQAELVCVHRMAVAMAMEEGRDPDRPPFLSRSVQFDAALPSARRHESIT
ncbi:MAG: SIS domain-containing protein [Actinomycetota bacterium]|nr:SIS domain-containing protein [Actinomycetota bacterium]